MKKKATPKPLPSIQFNSDDRSSNSSRMGTKPIPPPTRTAMGEYIVHPGGKPLTSLGDSAPGPADYFPKTDLTKSEHPHYSIVGKPKSFSVSREKPGPADYDTTDNTLSWSNKKYTLKGRGRCYITDEATKSNDILGKYYVKNNSVGKTGPHHKIGRRQKFKIFTGPPSIMLQAVDTHGFETPGPDYRPNSGYWSRGPEKSFGQGRKALFKATSEGPGPGDYYIKVPPKGPAYSFGIKLQRTLSTGGEGPGANVYNLGTTVGKAPSISISGRPEEATPALRVPSPSAYYPRDIVTSRATTLAYKWPDTVEDCRPVHPGPADYSVKYPHLHRNPSYTCRRRVKATYPESRLYQIKTEEETPSAAKYNVSKDFFDNDNPAYYIGERIPEISVKDIIPAPNHYHVEKKSKPGAKTAPAFSMAKRIKSPQSCKLSAGPASYFPKIISGSPKFTMRVKTKSTNRYTTPAANAYKLPETVSAHSRGVLLKSRPSPFVYSGFRTHKTYEPKTIPAVPSTA